ncbi:hypothetical protein ACFIOY_28260 [Bradyrhizobium sp. TZ2]
MLKGWNRKVRITSAISRAWITTRMVSPKPLSVFVLDVTLIAFPIPASFARTVAERFPHADRQSVRVRKMVSILLLRANSGANLNRPWLDIVAAAF